VLAWLLRRLEAELGEVPRPAAAEADALDPAELGWFLELDEARSQLHRARQTHWLADVEPLHPDPAALRRLDASRTRFYRVGVGGAARAVMRWRESPSEQDLAELICARYFQPTRDCSCSRSSSRWVLPAASPSARCDCGRRDYSSAAAPAMSRTRPTSSPTATRSISSTSAGRRRPAPPPIAPRVPTTGSAVAVRGLA
jgi:hypothetical protein